MQLRFITFILLLLSSSLSLAQTACIVGKNKASQNYVDKNIQKYLSASKKWGVNFKVKKYKAEQDILKDFKSGKCDLASLSSMHVKELNKKIATVGAIGALRGEEAIALIHKKLNLKKNARLYNSTNNNDYDVVGIIPMSYSYLFALDNITKGRLSLSNLGSNATHFDDDNTRAFFLYLGVFNQTAIGNRPSYIDKKTVFESAFKNGRKGSMMIVPTLDLSRSDLDSLADKGIRASDYPVRFNSNILLINRKTLPDNFTQGSLSWMEKNIDSMLTDVFKSTAMKRESKIWLIPDDESNKQYFKYLSDFFVNHLRKQSSENIDKRMTYFILKARHKTSQFDSEQLCKYRSFRWLCSR